jgi:hypothetical protein
LGFARIVSPFGMKYANPLNVYLGGEGRIIDMKGIRPLSMFLFCLLFSFGCMATKVVTTPVKWTVKGAAKTTKIVTKGAVKAGKGAVGVVAYPFKDDDPEYRDDELE